MDRPQSGGSGGGGKDEYTKEMIKVIMALQLLPVVRRKNLSHEGLKKPENSSSVSSGGPEFNMRAACLLYGTDTVR